MLNAQISHENPTIQSTANKVVIVDFNQPVVKYDYSGWLGTQSYMDILKQLAADESVAGVVLKIDSGGGQDGPAKYMISLCHSKPIVVSLMDICAVAVALIISRFSNKIIANGRAIDAIIPLCLCYHCG
jgi:protease-4